mmetsp:Transcript_125580/g.250552  ORF Transcript_125580/g.250552 Transcript_125580/m.250552 type:complete len:124 (-) Transcript_125580:1232-1603(-)
MRNGPSANGNPRSLSSEAALLSQAAQRNRTPGAVTLPKQVTAWKCIWKRFADAAPKSLFGRKPLAVATSTGVAVKHLAIVALLPPPLSIQPQAYRPSARASSFRSMRGDYQRDRGPELPNRTC